MSDARMRCDAVILVICWCKLPALHWHRRVFFIIGSAGEEMRSIEWKSLVEQCELLLFVLGLSLRIFSFWLCWFIGIRFLLTFCILALWFSDGKGDLIASGSMVSQIFFRLSEKTFLTCKLNCFHRIPR